MPRLPVPGQDVGTWGLVLNEFLSVSLNDDGTIKNSALPEIPEVSDASTGQKGIVQLAGDLGGSASNPTVTSTSLSSALPISQGGTGSTTKSFVDLTSPQTIAGTKTFSDQIQGNISGNAANVTGVVAIANGGTGSNTKNFVDLDSDQTIEGIKTFDQTIQADISGTASNVTETIAIENGGTGATTAASARNALLPNQSGNAGRVLQTDGTNASWQVVDTGPVVNTDDLYALAWMEI
jgi:hypothetical protein